MKCVWCNGRDGRLEELAVAGIPGYGPRVQVHPEHRAESVEFFDRARRKWSRALIAIVSVAVLMMIAVPLSIPLGSELLTAIVAGVGNVAIAVLVWRYPFPTPLTIRWLGIRRSVAIARGAALVLGLSGLWLIAGAPPLLDRL
jgi:hypothetical protein